MSVNHRECLGATKRPVASDCFAERAREKAQQSHLIVTNLSLLAIDAIERVPMIPGYDAVAIDEAHELTARVTQAGIDELAVNDVERASWRSQRGVEDESAHALSEAADSLAEAIEATAASACRPTPRTRLLRRRRRPHPGQGHGAGGHRQRRADGRQPRV
ncbi:hypothetical protein [Nocardioides sp. InS609-2]|uniref:hypothetical protein n=1 Tax=Nocardioides sp. InS609-2 TaxID=2760705 RepID=UPI0020BED132|nr:hypothetical protein [Nocardioides sp. InS609-2]